jgi:hypothetical protein
MLCNLSFLSWFSANLGSHCPVAGMQLARLQTSQRPCTSSASCYKPAQQPTWSGTSVAAQTSMRGHRCLRTNGGFQIKMASSLTSSPAPVARGPGSQESRCPMDTPRSCQSRCEGLTPTVAYCSCS